MDWQHRATKWRTTGVSKGNVQLRSLEVELTRDGIHPFKTGIIRHVEFLSRITRKQALFR